MTAETINGACAVVLAAGEGKRMRSEKPKVLLELQLKPMLGWVLDAVKNAGIEDVCVVTGCKREQTEKYIEENYAGCETVMQAERLGTGHAVMTARAFLEKHRGGRLLVCCGDAPFLTAETVNGALAQQLERGDAVTVVTAVLEDATGYGRIVRGEKGELLAIVEHKEATEQQREIREINSGIYWFEVDALLEVLDTEHLKASGKTGEYYLTDAVELILGTSRTAGTFIADDRKVALGANDPTQLHELNMLAREQILSAHIAAGVTMPCCDGIIIGKDVTIGDNTVILPGTILAGNTTIGSSCVIGPNSYITDCSIGDRVILNAVQAKKSTVLEDTDVGPFSQIRPNCTIGPRVHIGDFVEVKNSVLGEGTKVAHLTYVGDSDIGRRVNFGCGCVTVNYDGTSKARCTVGDDAFIGCNTNLVAPVRVGDRAYTAAGSTITSDVPDGALGIARQRQINKAGWADNRKKDK